MRVIVYSLPTSKCVKCKAVEIAMRRRGISVNKIQLDEDPGAVEFIKSLGYSEAPVIVVKDGDDMVDHWSGFSDQKISDLASRLAVA